MVTYSLPSFFGRTTDVWKNGGTEPLSTAAAVGRRSAHSLRYLCSTSIARITNQSALTDGLRLAGSRQRFRPREAKLPWGNFRVSGRAAGTASGHRYLRWSYCSVPLSLEYWSSPKAVSVVMSAGVRTSLLTPLSPSVQGRTEVRVIEPLSDSRQISARAALPMVDDSACDRNPLTAGRGSAGGSVIVPPALSAVP